MTIAIDFDGTIVEHRYPKIGNEIPFATDTLKMLIKDRHRLILWTVREGKLLDEAVEWCRERGVEFYAVNRDYPEEDAAHHGFSRKVKADLFIDDRNLGGLPDWGDIYRMVQEKLTYEELYRDTDKTPQQKRGGFHRSLLGWQVGVFGFDIQGIFNAGLDVLNVGLRTAHQCCENALIHRDGLGRFQILLGYALQHCFRLDVLSNIEWRPMNRVVLEVCQPNHDVFGIRGNASSGIGTTRLNDLGPNVSRHVGIASFARKPGVNQDDHIGPLIGRAISVQSEFAFAVVQPIDKRRVPKELWCVDQQADVYRYFHFRFLELETDT